MKPKRRNIEECREDYWNAEIKISRFCIEKRIPENEIVNRSEELSMDERKYLASLCLEAADAARENDYFEKRDRLTVINGGIK